MTRYWPIAVVLLAAACGSPQSPREVFTQFCTAMDEARREQAERCGMLHTAESCDGDAWTRTLARFDAGRISFDGSAAGACLQSARSTCERHHPACDDAFRGAVQGGGACGVDDDCASGECAITDACPGVCLGVAHEGESCAAFEVRCAEGTYCDSADECRRFAAEGEACDRNETHFGPGPLASDMVLVSPSEPFQLCAPGLTCERPGVCVAVPEEAPGAAGEPCAATGARDTCEAGLVCHHGFCVPVVAPGDACDGEGTWCPGTAGMCFDGRCTPLPTVGEACKFGGPPCAEQPYDPLSSAPAWLMARCILGKCEVYGLHGDACGRSEDCGLYSCGRSGCLSGICLP